MPAVVGQQSLFSHLSSSTCQTEVINVTNKNCNSKSNVVNEGLSQVGTFTWPSGAEYKGEFSNGQRNGNGVQTWQDGSSYKGEFLNDMRHGYGIHQWSSGEVYEGEFHKDHRHGKGTYAWPDGTKFTGMFYLDRKEGYGIFNFANGDKFEGLYKMDERFGPGALSYKDSSKGQDIGIWHRQQLLKLCIPANNTFSMSDHSEYEYYPEEQHSKLNLSSDYDNGIHNVFVRESSSYIFLSNEFKTSLFAENTALPPGIECYSSNFENLPLTSKHKEEFDKCYFGSAYEQMKHDISTKRTALNNTPLMIEVEKHVLRHRHMSNTMDFDTEAVMNADRSKFSTKSGHLETLSRSLIEKAAEGDERMVYSVLKTGLISPNVSDSKGNVALIGAAINCHHNIVNLLLDSGANVNQLNDEGVCALTACHVFYYPIDYFKPNGAQDSINEQLKINETQSNGDLAKPLPKFNLHADMNKKIEDMLPKKARIFGQLNADDAMSNMNLDTCKSDLKIMKSRQDRLLQREDGRQQNSSLLMVVEGDNTVLPNTPTSTLIYSDQPSFNSNQNMLKFGVDVSEDLINKTATLLSLNKQVVEGVTAKNDQLLELGTPAALAVWKAEHAQLHSMIKLLLQRGANPNTGSVPYPALFFAVKAGDVEAVDHLLEKGATTDHRLSKKQNGYGMLHYAAALRCPEAVQIIASLLRANANPNITALDEHVSYHTTNRGKFSGDQSAAEKHVGAISETSSNASITLPPDMTEETGRTPLHFACGRDDDYESCRDIVRLLLHHGANPDVNWSGFSPLTLAIASGNDMCVDELLNGGANPSLLLTRGVPTALCAVANIRYEYRRNLEDRLKLINILIAHEANILAPVQLGSKKLIGSVVDYAHWMFMSDRRIAHTPYHALSLDERDTYTARRTLLSHLGDLLREAAVGAECQRLIEVFKDGPKYPNETSPTKASRFLYTGARSQLQSQVTKEEISSAVAANRSKEGPNGCKTTIQLLKCPEISVGKVSFVPPQNSKYSTDGIMPALDDSKGKKTKENRLTTRGGLKRLPVWIPLFRYCYDCGRSVGVRLTACSRCREVYFCSRACKLKAWEERHKDECLRIKVGSQSQIPTASEVDAIFADHKLDETMERARVKTDSIVGALLDRHLIMAEEKLLASRRFPGFGSRQQSRATTAKSSAKFRGHGSSGGSKRAQSSKKSIKSHASSKGTLSNKQNPAHVSRKTRTKVGKDVVFGTTGMTLAELGITENYSFE